MTTQEAQPREDPRSEIADLRRDLLPTFLAFCLLLIFFWYIYISSKYQYLGLYDIPIIIFPFFIYFSYKYRSLKYNTSCYILLFGMVSAYTLQMVSSPTQITYMWSSLSIVIASALLGVRAGAGVATMIGTVQFAMLFHGPAIEVSSWSIMDAIAPPYLVCLAVWLASRPLETAIQWAFAGWRRAHEVAAEVQTRRGELYRVVRSLEEATYRIERMNNDLIVARQAAEEARSIKSRFVATVSHELRGPLNIILGYSKLMVMSPENYPELLPRSYRSDLYTVYRSAQHLSTLVDDVLDLSQIESQHLPLIKERIDLEKDVLDKAIDIVWPLIERKKLFLERKFTGDLPCVMADPVRLRQVTLNLLTNAVRFTEVGGITVRTLLEDEQIRVTVGDTGPGIAVEDRSKLFREFHQVQQAGGSKDGGSGLGLAISKHLVESHGGRMGLASSDSTGSEFYFTLPLFGVQPIVVKERPKYGSHRMAQPTCLVVHDDPYIVRQLARHVQGYQIIGLADPTEVGGLVRELHPHSILVNPDLEPTVRQHLGELSSQLPLIVCGLPRTIGEDCVKGVIGYLVKPFDVDMLMAVMHRLQFDEETTILLVDDDRDTVRLLERMLTMLPHPYRILKAYGGQQAIELMQEQPPHIVFLDLLMPEMSGWELLERMRSDPLTKNVPVMIVSAGDWADEEMIEVKFPLQVDYRQSVDLGRAAICLKNLLDLLKPDYSGEFRI